MSSGGEGTLGGLLTWGREQLRLGGYPEPRHCHELIAALRDLSQAELLLRLDQEEGRGEREQLVQGISRLLSGEPLAYVAGRTGFRHLVLRCDRRALIPRPETESVVGEALQLVTTGVAADIGCGTGAIALALQQEGDFERVIGVDSSPEALQLARENGEATGLAVEWQPGDLLEPLLVEGVQLDLLVSNPPYLAELEFAGLDPSVRDYEPTQALVSGVDGLAATRRLLAEGQKVVRRGGWLVLEVDAQRGKETADLAREWGWIGATVHKDLFGRPRTLVARRGEDG